VNDDFWSWQSRKLGAGAPHKRLPAAPEVLDREEPAAPSEPIEVQEHHASTTIIERLYQVIGKRRG
jgi:hypothetical protein